MFGFRSLTNSIILVWCITAIKLLKLFSHEAPMARTRKVNLIKCCQVLVSNQSEKATLINHESSVSAKLLLMHQQHLGYKSEHKTAIDQCWCLTKWSRSDDRESDFNLTARHISRRFLCLSNCYNKNLDKISNVVFITDSRFDKERRDGKKTSDNKIKSSQKMFAGEEFMKHLTTAFIIINTIFPSRLESLLNLIFHRIA